MRPLGTEFRVGIFALLASGAIITIFFFLNPESFRGGNYKSYYTIADNAEGIVERTHVRTNGVNVGQVATISLLKNRTKITLNVHRDVPVPRGSKVEIRSRGLLGDKYLEIIRSDQQDMAQEDSELQIAKDQLSPEEAVAFMGNIAKDVKRITVSLANALDSTDGNDRLESIFGDLSGLLDDLRQVIADNRETISSTVNNLHGAASEIGAIVQDNKTQIDNIVTNISVVTDTLQEMINEENRDKFNTIIDKFENSVNDIHQTTGHLKLVAKKVEQGEGTLGKLLSDDSTITKIEDTIDGINKVLSPAKKLKVKVDYRGELRADRTSQHYFNLLFHTRADKYYLFGVTDMGEQVVSIKKDTSPFADEEPAENVSYETATITEQKRLRFNLQFAKRWQNIGWRFGLFESKGGVASDFYLWQDRMQLTVEAFDWDFSDDNKLRKVAHFKAYTKILFLKHLALLAGIDDPTRLDQTSEKIRDNLNYFFGAGFSFSDNDLKGFLATAAMAL